MKTTFVSSAAVTSALRYSLLRQQSELAKAQKEASSGFVADTGLALGARTAQSVTLHRDLERLGGIVDSNGLVSARLSATQKALTQVGAAAQSFLSSLTSSASGDAAYALTQKSGRATLDTLTSVLNTSLNGEYLFSGTNTDVKPINDFKPGSATKVAFDAAFAGYFGFNQNHADAQDITAADMNNFMTTVVEPMFLGTGWQAAGSPWSNATNQGITSRITLNETTETSVSANNEGIRKIAMSAAIISDLLDSNVGNAARGALVTHAVSSIGEAISDIGQLEAQTGIIEQRVKSATDRINVQVDLYERYILDTEGVDYYVASARVADLVSQIDRSYALTARIQQLSLMKYL
ncbi:flagellar hook-associated family protein [Aminobacter niigataensis]|uniref:flagellar hook-associated family protein n=1 Tax=Aminobacter niigataensis TaxID=83265 RepID=UPI0024C56325|nr:flagellar hook-associated family protein [Aminobacter niigataensis]CAI2933349.1 Flagellar hook-associated protein flgL [Aminobacter niigataensis]